MKREEEFDSIENIGDILKPYLKKIKEKRERYNTLKKVWNECVSENIQKNTQIIELKKDILYIGVSTPTYYFELKNFKKYQILNKVRNLAFEKKIYIKDITFIFKGEI